ncbi:MAG: DUF308 domain-containing protein [Clostridia bacterium]
MKEKTINFLKTPLVISVLLFILGAILFTNPENLVKFVTYGFGGLFILTGFIKLANYLGARKKDCAKTNDLIYAIVSMTCGVVIIICTSIIEQTLRIIMGGFILYNGIMRLITALKLKDSRGSIWKGHLIVSIVIMLVGLYVILKSNLIFSAIGLFIMVYSALEIVLCIMSSKSIIIK